MLRLFDCAYSKPMMEAGSSGIERSFSSVRMFLKVAAAPPRHDTALAGTVSISVQPVLASEMEGSSHGTQASVIWDGSKLSREN